MRLKRAAGWLAALLAVGVLAALALAWVAGREATLQWAAERAVRATDGRLQIDAPAGSLYGDIRAPRLEWRDDTVHVVLHDVRLQYELRPLLRRHLVVNALSARHVELRLHESEDAPAQPRSPPQLPEHLELPLRLTLQQARIDRLSVTPVGAEQPIDLDAIALAADYDGSRFAIERFALQTPWGRGAVDGTVGDRAPYPLALRLRFEPAQLDAPIDATVGGDLQRLSVGAASQARGASVRLDARLAPLAQDPLQALTALSAQAEGVDLAAWGEGLPSTQLQIGLEATGTERAALTVRNAMPGPIDAQR
ncbi:MAG TPA: hypothetical protein VM491_23155, partial [Burkholderiaceae bacterium]|nr:hypothetical protein [Burkholderiaceae bacterium]